ncbi:hypothetical protein [Sphingomonas sp. Leaf231]|uniref:hypothetical protein n=1 Tax=Sphingomonas sp. Leaf231 TaxID=1736301 RepID=UPI000AAEC551|nr:hypothetical protein [Sphingomonas sp. Leaf231]
MAKKNKTKAGRLPKEVLGVKVPKEWRKAGERLIEQAQGPAGRQAIAGAVTAVVGAVATAALTRESAKAAGTREAANAAGTREAANAAGTREAANAAGTREAATAAGTSRAGETVRPQPGAAVASEAGEALARAAEALIGRMFVRRP